MVTISLFLFGKPGQELNEGGEVTPDELRALGKDLRARLEETADLLEKLTAAGWEAQMGLYDVMLSHPYLRTASEAEAKLLDLGIDPEKVCLDEWPDEDEEEGERDD
ncbi:MAG TPA: hypothetical protein VNK04_24585 [Gemmataceae bacterium]|jgi:hypothetical protein|nr:hypothetical protein [Gemmataceae bacterium]